MDSWTKEEKLCCAAGSHHRDFGPFTGDDPQNDFGDDWGTAFCPLVRMLFAPEQDSQAAVPSIDDLSLSQSFSCWDQQPWSRPESQRVTHLCSQTPDDWGTAFCPLVRMLFAPEQDSQAAVPSIDDLSLSQSFSCWDQQPWSRPESQRVTHLCSQTPALDLLGASEGGHSGRTCVLMGVESASADPTKHFSNLVVLFRFHSVLHLGSSSPFNSENSAISSGYDPLVFGGVSPPSPLILPRMRAEGVKLDTDTRLEQNLNAFMNTPSAWAEGSVEGYQSTGPVWPSWDTLGLNKHLERQAKLQGQAAALDLLGASEGGHSGRTCVLMGVESASADPTKHFSNLVVLFRFHSVLHLGSSSPFNSENSAISSGYDPLVFGGVSPPSPLILPRMRAEGVKLDTDTRLEQNLNAFMNTPSAWAEGSVEGYQSTGPVWPSWDTLGLNKHLERQAKLHKQAAALNEATCTWEGCLPPRHYNNPVYSCKVFLGGVPWDITEVCLLKTFSVFGPLNVEWPCKDGRRQGCPGLGYVYLLFDSEKSVKMLLEACTQQHLQSDDHLEFYYKLSSKQVYNKDVQVIPWVISDYNFIRFPSERCYYRNTVFVGALHGLINAEGLALIMDELFGGVMYADIYIDKHKYPTGSGKVTFRDQSNYLKAVSAAFVLIKTSTFIKKIQIDPYLHYSVCQTCYSQPGLFFCRARVCLKYYCLSCWHWRHCLGMLHRHQPLMLHRKRPEPQL